MRVDVKNKSFVIAGFNNQEKSGINFGFLCRSNAFEIKKLPNITCPCCGKNMITTGELKSFGQNIIYKSGVRLVRELSNLVEFTTSAGREIVELIIKQAANPEFQFDNIQEIVAKLINQNTSYLSLSKISYSFLQQSQKPKNNTSEFWKQLFSDAQSTTEHIIPKAFTKRKIPGYNQANIDNTDNFLAMCRSCNGRRGSGEFYQWVCGNPMMPIYSQDYISSVSKRIVEHQLLPYVDYPKSISDTLLKESKGLIQLTFEQPYLLEKEIAISQKRREFYFRKLSEEKKADILN